MKTLLFYAAACALLLSGCHESLEKRAQREAREFTEKYCPTPVQNYMRTDSVVFDTETKTYNYYCSVVNELDDRDVFNANRDKIVASFEQILNENTSFRVYKREGFNFAWTLRSAREPGVMYCHKVFTAKEYNK